MDASPDAAAGEGGPERAVAGRQAVMDAMKNDTPVAQYAELYKELGSYPYDQDPLRAGWTPTIPNNRWADPNDARCPTF